MAERTDGSWRRVAKDGSAGPRTVLYPGGRKGVGERWKRRRTMRTGSASFGPPATACSLLPPQSWTHTSTVMPWRPLGLTVIGSGRPGTPVMWASQPVTSGPGSHSETDRSPRSGNRGSCQDVFDTVTAAVVDSADEAPVRMRKPADTSCRAKGSFGELGESVQIPQLPREPFPAVVRPQDLVVPFETQRGSSCPPGAPQDHGSSEPVG